MKDAFALSTEEVLEQWGVKFNDGLSKEEALQRLAKYGRNRIEESIGGKKFRYFKRIFD